MADTPNHGYSVPDEGEENWHVPLNENFEAFEVDVELRDEEANLNDYDPTEGAKFLATDTEAVYLGDGSDWNELQTSGSDPSFDELNPSNNFLGVGRDTRITGSEFFGVQATVKSGDYGGMYVNAADPDAWPFYGYATDGNGQAWHYYDGSTDKWHLNNGGNRLTVQGDGNVGVGTTDPSATLEVDGNVGVGDLGASVYQGSEQTVPEGEITVVDYDTVIADDRNEVDLSSDEFECAYDGDYHVEASLSYRFEDDPVAGRYDLSLSVNGDTKIRDTVTVPEGATSPATVNYTHLSVSKTLRGLSAGDTVDVETVHFTEGGNDQTTFGFQYDTYLTIDQVG